MKFLFLTLIFVSVSAFGENISDNPAFYDSIEKFEGSGYILKEIPRDIKFKSFKWKFQATDIRAFILESVQGELYLVITQSNHNPIFTIANVKSETDSITYSGDGFELVVSPKNSEATVYGSGYKISGGSKQLTQMK